jgi:nitroreductase
LEVIEAIRTRRSVRRYKKTSVPKQVILDLLEAANLAPTATNRQPWGFVVMDRHHIDRLYELLDKAFAERVRAATADSMRAAIKDLPIPVPKGADKLEGLGHFYRTLGNAPVAILVHVPRETDPWLWKNNICDGAAAIQNLLLAAWNQGLGTCWMTGPLKSRGQDIAGFLNVPQDRELIALITLGYPDHQPKSSPKGMITSKMHWLWGN